MCVPSLASVPGPVARDESTPMSVPRYPPRTVPTFSDARFPRLSEYLAGLPAGLDSYPDCLAKGSISRLALQGYEWLDLYKELPAPLAAGLQDRPLPSAWLPEVHSVALHLAVADGEAMDDRQVMKWSRVANTRLAESTMYQIVAKVASPSVLLRTAALSWRLLHRGVVLRIDDTGRGHAAATISHPAWLWTEIVHRSTSEGLRVAVETAGGRNVTAEPVRCEADHGRYKLIWD